MGSAWILWLAMACTPTDTANDTAIEDTGSDTTEDTATDDTGPVDLDGDGVIAAEDCDDTDLDVFPGALEVLFDDVDQDCDGGPNSSPLHHAADAGGAGLRWTAPEPVQVAAMDDYFLLATAATAVDALTAVEPRAYLLFDADSGPSTPSVTGIQTFGEGQPRGAGVGLEATGNVAWLGSTYAPASTQVRTAVHELSFTTDTPIPAPLLSVQSLPGGPLNVDLDSAVEAASGTLWMAACAPSILRARAEATPVDLAGSGDPFTTPAETGIDAPLTCMVQPPSPGSSVAIATVCGTDACEAYDLDGATGAITLRQDAPPPAILLHHKQGVTYAVYADGTATVDAGSGPVAVFDGVTVQHLDGQRKDGVHHLVAVVDEGDGLGAKIALETGPLGAATDRWTLTSSDGSSSPSTSIHDPTFPSGGSPRWLTPQTATLAVGEDRMMVAYTGTGELPGEDAVGWTFLALP